jgi:hypothetical protein
LKVRSLHWNIIIHKFHTKYALSPSSHIASFNCFKLHETFELLRPETCSIKRATHAFNMWANSGTELLLTSYMGKISYAGFTVVI